MRRPLPPDLVALGDALEAAVERALARRRVRRQLAMNAIASVMVALPLAIGVSTAHLSRQVVTPSPTPAAARQATTDAPRSTRVGAGRAGAVNPRLPGVNLPREQVRLRPELSKLPSKIRPALR
jgi:hypothetical protein